MSWNPEKLKAELALDARATLGECIRWDAREKLIYWVDIPGRKMHRYDPSQGRNDTMALNQEMGCAFLNATVVAQPIVEFPCFAKVDDIKST